MRLGEADGRGYRRHPLELLDAMIYCNIMAHRHDHVSHAAAAQPTLSLLRLSAGQRLLGVAGVIAPLWALVWLILGS